MKDNFEKFVEDNRADFDVYEPGSGLWISIDEKLSKRRHMKWMKYYVAAASVLLIGGLTIWLIPGPQQSMPPVAVGVTAPDLRNTEIMYTSMIEEKRSELSKYCSLQPLLCSQFGKELDTLNILYGQLKSEYDASANREVVLQAMITNLQLQVNILAQQLQIIQHIPPKNKQRKMI